MRWVTAVRRLLSNGSDVGAGNVGRTGGAATGRRWQFQPGALAPFAPIEISTELHQSYNAWRSAGRTKFWGRPQDIDAGSQVREQRVVCAHCCVGEPVEVTSKR